MSLQPPLDYYPPGMPGQTTGRTFTHPPELPPQRMQEPPYRQAIPPQSVPRPAEVVGVPATRSSPIVPIFLGVIAVLLVALLASMVVEIRASQQSLSTAKSALAVAQKSHLTSDTRGVVQAAYDTSNSTLATMESNFTKSVFNTASTDSAPKQQVAELEYMFEMQVLIAEQNKAMLKALLDS